MGTPPVSMLSTVRRTQRASDCNSVHGRDVFLFFLNKIPNVYKQSSFSASVPQLLRLPGAHPGPPGTSSPAGNGGGVGEGFWGVTETLSPAVKRHHCPSPGLV